MRRSRRRRNEGATNSGVDSAKAPSTCYGRTVTLHGRAACSAAASTDMTTTTWRADARPTVGRLGQLK